MPGGCRRRLGREDQPEPTDQRTMEAVMTVETDPKLVREIAEAALRSAMEQRRDVSVGIAIYDRDGTPLSQDAFRALHDAVAAEYDRLAAVAGSATANAGHYARVLGFVMNLPAEGDAIAGFNRGGKRYELTGADLRGLLDDYSAAVQSMVKIENIVTAFDERGE